MLRTGTNLFANSGLNIQTLMNFICIYLQRVLDEELNDLSDFIFDNGTLSNRTCFVQNCLGEGGVWFSYQGVGGGTGGGYYLIVFLYCFLCVLLSFGLSCPASFLSEE